MVLVLIGVITYFATGGASVTALIPAFIGVPMLVAGFLITRSGTSSLGLYLAAALALLMALGTLRGVSGLFGGEVSTATVVNVVLLLMSVGYLIVAVRNIFAARRRSSESA